MGEWIKFVPGKEYIGLRARFRKVVDGNIEEVEGTIVNDPGAHPWHHNVAISRESDGERLPFPNGLPSYYLRGGEKHYISEPFEVAYYYQPINELDKRAEEYMRSVMRNDGDVFTRSDLYEYITEAWKAGYAEGATTVNYIQCRDCPKRVYYGLAPNMRFSDGENLIFFAIHIPCGSNKYHDSSFQRHGRNHRRGCKSGTEDIGCPPPPKTTKRTIKK